MSRLPLLLAVSLCLCGSVGAQTLTITTTSIPDGEVDAPYWAVLQATGGTPYYRWSFAGGTLPEEMWINVSGEIGGQPRIPGTFTFTAQVEDAFGLKAQKAFTFSVVPGVLRFSTTSLPSVYPGSPYWTIVSTLGGTNPLTYSIVEGALPSGITMALSQYSPDEVYDVLLSGTTIAVGTHTFTIKVTDSAVPPQTATQTLQITVFEPAPLSISATTLSRAYAGEYYLEHVYINGGARPFSISATGLPEGMWVEVQRPEDIHGRVGGTPAAAGIYQVAITVTDALNTTATRTFALEVVDPVHVVTTHIPDVYPDEPYSATLEASGGKPPYTWWVSYPPPGLAVDATGVVSGVYTGPGNSSTWLSVSACDSTTIPICRAASVYVLIRAPRIGLSPSKLPTGSEGSGYYAQLQGRGGSMGYTYSVAAGELPPGLELHPGLGVITGSALRAGRYNFSIKVEDRAEPPDTFTRAYALTIGPPRGRNNTLASATPLRDGRHRASISPLEEGGAIVPDVDVYAITVQRGQTLRVEIFAQRKASGSPLDSVLEIVDANGVRLMNCAIRGTVFTDVCFNDDVDGLLDSRLYLHIPGTGTQTVYARVLDWRGDARPDLVYEIEIAGSVVPPPPPIGTPRKRLPDGSR